MGFKRIHLPWPDTQTISDIKRKLSSLGSKQDDEAVNYASRCLEKILEEDKKPLPRAIETQTVMLLQDTVQITCDLVTALKKNYDKPRKSEA